jgi:hypothetical protein
MTHDRTSECLPCGTLMNGGDRRLLARKSPVDTQATFGLSAFRHAGCNTASALSVNRT